MALLFEDLFKRLIFCFLRFLTLVVKKFLRTIFADFSTFNRKSAKIFQLKFFRFNGELKRITDSHLGKNLAAPLDIVRHMRQVIFLILMTVR